MLREKAQDAKMSRPKVSRSGGGTDWAVGAMKAGNAAGAKGPGQSGDRDIQLETGGGDFECQGF